jgi:hypothetical protein
MRALILALDRWVKDGTVPPPSRYPQIANRTLAPAAELKWPELTGFNGPRGPNPMLQFNYGKRIAQGVIDNAPPVPVKGRYAVLVPVVDADGNEAGGLRMPEQAVPFATSTGWSLRGDQAGGTGELCYLDGVALPFAPNASAREAAKDPRPSLAERYGDKQNYLAKVRDAALNLQREGYVLAEDIERIVARAERLARFDNGQ